jgi:HemY protein
MKYAWILVAVLVAGLLIGPYWSGSTGYVLISIGNWTIETSLIAALIMLLVLTIVLRALIRAILLLVRKTQWGVRWFGERKHNKAQQAFTQAAQLLVNGEPAAASQAFGRSWGLVKQPLTATFAAYAAQQAGDISLARDWLSKIDNSADFQVADTILSLRAKPELARQKLALLQRLTVAHPDNIALLKVALQTYQQLHRWQDIIALLPQARRLNCLTATEQFKLTEQAYAEVMHEIGRSRADQLEPYWNKLSREQRRSPPIRLAYIATLSSFGLNDAAGKLAARALKRGDLKLVDLIERKLVVNQDELKGFLQDSLKHSPDDAMLLHALGQIALQNKDYELASRALRRAADSAPSRQVLLDLAYTYEMTGDSKRSLSCYRDALKI